MTLKHERYSTSTKIFLPSTLAKVHMTNGAVLGKQALSNTTVENTNCALARQLRWCHHHLIRQRAVGLILVRAHT